TGFDEGEPAMRRQARPASFWLLAVLTLVLLAVVLLPFAVVIAGAVLNTSFLGISTEPWAGDAGASIISFHWFGYVWDLYHNSFYFSLRVAVLSTLLCLLIGVPGGYVLAQPGLPGRRLAEAVVMLPLALPGIAMSIALIQAWAMIRGSWWLILGGHLLYTIPFMVRVVIDGLRSFDRAELEACARGMGATFWQRFRMIVLPSLRPSMVAGSLMVFAVSWGEFNVSYLLNTPVHQTYPAALYATYTSNSFQVGSAATVIFLCVVVPALLGIQWLGGRPGASTSRFA
ncbi:MAG: binding--dependent transport system inner rane component family protein, partial [Verrucomicrobiaceae bacterium]|nr:binding--dependent transport system inner rane component family protein [Verrucomicrobiaceae bacterium]